jgi:hypothetical protein
VCVFSNPFHARSACGRQAARVVREGRKLSPTFNADRQFFPRKKRTSTLIVIKITSRIRSAHKLFAVSCPLIAFVCASNAFHAKPAKMNPQRPRKGRINFFATKKGLAKLILIKITSRMRPTPKLLAVSCPLSTYYRKSKVQRQ